MPTLTAFNHASPDTPYRVLIVDDNENHLKLEKDILASPRFEVHEATRGEQALELLQRHDFDVVLLDKNMPGMSGDEVCQRIRRHAELSLLPVLMVTGSNSREDFLASMQAGASDFIRKPYNPLELIARTENFARQKRQTDQLDSAESLLFTLARMVESRDAETGDHCSRLAHSATVFGEALGLDAGQIHALQRGAILHDLGKLGIPDSILLKKGPLDEEEWALMRQHTVIGERLLGSLKSMAPVLPIVRHHHERWDGGGYPDGLAGEAIPLLARVFQLVDIYDALAFERPYKSALPLETIIGILEQERDQGWRDPELTNAFLQILHERPGDLELPAQQEKNLSDHLFEQIASTGVLQWAR